jgi:ABC-type arginine/histidine transport system permease subunit
MKPKLEAPGANLLTLTCDKLLPSFAFNVNLCCYTSEILTGALKDNCRATVSGSRTYGKGLIQSVYELSDGSGLVLTVGKYVTPVRRCKLKR